MSFQEKKKNPSAFLRALYQILMREQVKQIICWAPNENGFVIKNLQIFEQSILPQYFKHKKYTSFVRQLNMYGFHKQRSISNQNCFLHDTFKKSQGIPADIRRKPQKKKKSDGIINKQSQEKDNWFQIGKQLRIHFPHIISYNNPEIIEQREQNSKFQQSITITKNDSESKPQKQQIEMSQQSEQYISKISLKGLFQNSQSQQKKQKNSQNVQIIDQKRQFQFQRKGQENQFNKNDSNNKSILSQMQIQRIVMQNQDDKNKKALQSNNLLKEEQFSSSFYQQNTSNYTKNSIQNINSLSALCQILLKHNKILQSTHSQIRKACLQSQKFQIQFKKQELNYLKGQQNQCEFRQKQNQIAKNQNKFLLQTSQTLIQRTFKLKQLVQEDNMISTTSIKFNLQK